MAPHDEATFRRLQYTVYLTGVFLSMPWKRLLRLNRKQPTTELEVSKNITGVHVNVSLRHLLVQTMHLAAPYTHDEL